MHKRRHQPVSISRIPDNNLALHTGTYTLHMPSVQQTTQSSDKHLITALSMNVGEFWQPPSHCRANCRQLWLVSRHLLMTSLIMVAYVIEACFISINHFLSTLWSFFGFELSVECRHIEMKRVFTASDDSDRAVIDIVGKNHKIVVQSWFRNLLLPSLCKIAD